MNKQAALLDTSFFLRFLNESDPLFESADSYFRYFLQKDISMLISTISIAEFCVGGDVHELPLRNLQILPFNLNHARKAGGLARVVFANKGKLKLQQRSIIPNDTKLFAQADVELAIQFYVSSDTESAKIYSLLSTEQNLKFQFIDLNTPYHETFGILNL